MFIEFHCVHNDGPVFIDPEEVNEIRKMSDDKHPNWTRLRMKGSPDVEIREDYIEVKNKIDKFRK